MPVQWYAIERSEQTYDESWEKKIPELVLSSRPRQEILLSCLVWLHQLLDSANIQHWLTAGSLLGSYRHGGFIPHDDDLDLGCWEDDVERIRELISQVGGDHQELCRFSWSQWNKTTFACVRFFPFRFARAEQLVIDLFYVPRQALRYNADEPKELAHEILPLQTASFHGLLMRTPNQASAYLTRVYPGHEGEVVLWTHEARLGLCRLPLAHYQTLLAALPPFTPPLPLSVDLRALLHSLPK